MPNKKIKAQAWKINMLRRTLGFNSKNTTKIFKRHKCGRDEYLPGDVICGEADNTWWVACSGAAVGDDNVLVSYVVGTDMQCECIDYPSEYVCRECEICIHMYTCSCREVDMFPALICKHIHAVLL